MLFKKKNKKKKLSVREQMIKYMEEKYDEKFIPGLFQEANWAYNYDSMSFKSEKFPYNGDFIGVEKEGNGFVDNYVAYLLRDEHDRILQEIASEIYGKCKVITLATNIPQPKEFNKNTTFEEFSKSHTAFLKGTIYVDSSEIGRDYEACLELLQAKLKEKGLVERITLYVLIEGKNLEDITRETKNDILSLPRKWFQARGSYSFRDDFTILYNCWEVY